MIVRGKNITNVGDAVGYSHTVNKSIYAFTIVTTTTASSTGFSADVAEKVVYTGASRITWGSVEMN